MDGGDVTVLLRRWHDGDVDAGEAVMALLYPEVRRIAGHEFQRERRDHTLQPTALAHEVYMRMAKGGGIDASGRSHFLGIAAKVVRRVLIEHSRERRRRKRGGDQVRVELDDELLCGTTELDFVDLDRALETLKESNAEAAAVVELKFFGGLTVDEIAGYLGISKATVSRKWTVARAWLRGELEQD